MEIDSFNKMINKQKKNYKKIILKNDNDIELINKFSDINIKSCRFNLVLEKFNSSDAEPKNRELDYICDIVISQFYENTKESFFELIKYEVFKRDTLNFMSSKKYNFKYIFFSFIAFISFIFLILINIRRKNL